MLSGINKCQNVSPKEENKSKEYTREVTTHRFSLKSEFISKTIADSLSRGKLASLFGDDSSPEER